MFELWSFAIRIAFQSKSKLENNGRIFKTAFNMYNTDV